MLKTIRRGEPSATGQAIVCIDDGGFFVMLAVIVTLQFEFSQKI
jgi:hypothetical protein